MNLFIPRWSKGRFGDSGRDMAALSFATRSDRLGACLKYPLAVGFVIARLYGHKHRLTTFKLRKLVYSSESMEFSNVISNTIDLKPGRYVVIPYTSFPVTKATDYILEMKYPTGAIEFEVEDLLKERLIDEEPSGDDTEESDSDDSDEDNEDFKAERAARRKEREDKLLEAAAFGPEPVKIPNALSVHDWEWKEDTEEFGIKSVYEEVSDLAKQMASMRASIQEILTNRSLNESNKISFSSSSPPSSPPIKSADGNSRKSLSSPTDRRSRTASAGDKK